KMNLSENQITHLASLSPEQQALLEFERKIKESQDKIESLGLLDKKLTDQAKLKVEGSLLSLLNEHINDWASMVVNSKELTTKDITSLKDMLKDRKQELQDEKDIHITQRDYIKAVLQAPEIQKMDEEINKIKDSLNNLTLEEKSQKMSERGKPFSKEAWIAYELAQVTETLGAAQAISIYCLMRPFDKQKEQILEALFENKFPPNFSDQGYFDNWRQFLPPEFKDITKEEMTSEIYESLRQNAKSQKDILIDKQNQLRAQTTLYKQVSPFFYGDYERFVTKGHAPDSNVHLPVSGLNDSDYLKPGLNIERMLKKMHDLTQDGQKFNLTTKNCSMTTGAILASGAEPQLRDFFEDKAWGGFGNPQVVYKGAILYGSAISKNNAQKTFWQKLSKWNPLNVVSFIGGKMLSAVADPKTNIVAKIALGIGLIPMGVLAGCVQTIKAVFNPRKTFVNCSQFVNYAWKNNSVFLKIASIPVALLATVAAVPALLQHGVDKLIVEPLTKPKKTHIDEQPNDIKQPKRIPLDKEKVITVNEPHPELAIAQLAQFLQQEPDKVPMFSVQTQSNVDAYMKTLDRNKPSDLSKIEAYEKTVKGIYERVNEQSLPVVNKQEELKVSEPRRHSMSSFEHFKAKQSSENVPDLPKTPPTKPRSSSHSQRLR
ncbi:MAG: hypothetical protein AB7V32_07040, partial [Candidatus Berkiella sp.]